MQAVLSEVQTASLGGDSGEPSAGVRTRAAHSARAASDRGIDEEWLPQAGVGDDARKRGLEGGGGAPRTQPHARQQDQLRHGDDSADVGVGVRLVRAGRSHGVRERRKRASADIVAAAR